MVIIGSDGPCLRVRGSDPDAEDEEGGQSEDNIDERRWREDCIDLHRVMTVAQAVWLVLEHHNEALVRVCLEIATCRKSKKCLWWQLGWYGDDHKRDWLKQVVRDKLNRAIALARGGKVEVQELDDVGNAEEIERLRKKLSETEGSLQKARMQQDIAEQRVRELMEQLDAANARMAELEKACESLRQELRKTKEEAEAALKAAIEEAAKGGTGSVTKDNGKDQLADLERKRKQGEETIKKLEQQLSELTAQLKEYEQRQTILEETDGWFSKIFRGTICNGLKMKDGKGGNVSLDEAKRNLDKYAQAYRDLENKLKDSSRQVVVNRPEKEAKKKQETVKEETPEEEKPRKVKTEPVASTDNKDLEEAEARNRELEAERKRLEDRLQNLLDELELLKKQLEREKTARMQAEADLLKAKNEIERLSGRPAPREAKKEEVVETPKAAVDPEIMEELKALRKMKEAYEELQKKNKNLIEKNRKLNLEKAEMQEQIDRLLKLLAQVKEQLRRIMEIAEKKGLGAQVKEIMDEANLTETLNSPEFTCFDRLYEDALRRQRKMREIERMKLGLGPGPDDMRGRSSSGEVLRRGRNGVIGYGSDYGNNPSLYSGGGMQYHLDSGSEYSGYGSRSRSASPAFGYGGYDGGSAVPSRSRGRVCGCGNTLFDDSVFCRKCGKKWEEGDQERARSPGGRMSLQRASLSRERAIDALKERRGSFGSGSRPETPQQNGLPPQGGVLPPSRQLMPPGPLDLPPPSAHNAPRRDVYSGMGSSSGFGAPRNLPPPESFGLGGAGPSFHGGFGAGLERRQPSNAGGLQPMPRRMQQSASDAQLPMLGGDGPRRVLVGALDGDDGQVQRVHRHVQVLTMPDKLRTGPGALRGHYFSSRYAMAPGLPRENSPPRFEGRSGSTPDLAIGMGGKRMEGGPGGFASGGTTASGWAVTNSRMGGMPSLGHLAKADVSAVPR
eukprot:TRINITY_DN7753_c0_g1_i1.p1 TRINITY_DN7753_c0_g1~~TRINITY_DN7753_c0_g1_i1.p1  ORF type:complete len:956 (+),score=282.03 TRINITY_DN7753_c0_g1_i1:193-3060(+)